MFEYYNHLGFHSPYYFITNKNSLCLKSNFSSICEAFEGQAQLDIPAIIYMLNRKYILADRTLIKGIQKAPWMARPDSLGVGWQFASVPDHQERMLPNRVIAKKLFSLIKEEIKEYIGKSKRIGVLLSGGMDSRIVAGTLDYLIDTGELCGIQVTGLTWGMEDSRDVVYANQIAEILNWDWKHYTVEKEDLIENIEVAATNGSEYSPVHLHAMLKIREEKSLDCILAGSFGDSVGRGEYSGRKVADLRSIANGFNNVGHLLNSKAYRSYVDYLLDDIQIYHDRFPQKKMYQLYEQDYQIHYMRRMLNSCMSVINEKIPLYQVFTKPDVFGFMWSLSPKVRDDSVYSYLLRFLKPELSNIPWARTGVAYGSSGKKDGLLKQHHKYFEIISGDLLDEIKSIIFSSSIFELGVFNKKAVYSIFKAISIGPKEDNDFYAERIIWLASLSKTIDRYDIVNKSKFSSGLIDSVNGLVGSPSSYVRNFAKKKILRYIK